MKNFAVEILSQTASFRNPDFQNFHKSLDLPPPTTVIGLAGAALGVSPLQAQEFFEENEFKIGIHGFFSGKCSDTWKYNKRTKEMWLYRPDKDGSIIQKEFLIHSCFVIAFSSDKNETLAKLFNAFHNPIYALTMGNSDSLAFIKKIGSDLDEAKSLEVENCIIDGDVIENVMSLSSENMEFSIYHTSEPIAYDLPTRFQYASNYGKRSVSKVATYSFVGKKMRLNYEIEGLLYRDIFIPLIKI